MGSEKSNIPTNGKEEQRIGEVSAEPLGPLAVSHSLAEGAEPGVDRPVSSGEESRTHPAEDPDLHTNCMEAARADIAAQRRAALNLVEDAVAARREAERSAAELRISEEHLRALFAQVVAGIAETDLHGRFILTNDRYCEMTGYSREELLNMRMMDITHKDDLAGNLILSERLVTKREPFEIEKRYLRKDGSIIWVHNSVAPIAGAGGEVSGVVAVSIDITKRKQAEAELVKSEERFSRFMEHLPGLAWIKDAEGRYVYANAAAEGAFGMSKDILFGKTDEEIFPAETAAQFRENDELAYKGGTQAIEELKHKDGSVHSSIVNKFPILEPDGGPGLIGGMAIDITDRIRVEKSLRESEERRKLAQEAGNVGVFDWDIIADKTYWSETMWEFYGEKRRELNPDERFWSEHIHGTDRERVKANIRQAVTSGSDKFGDEFRIVRPDGTIRWIEAKARISRDESGVATRMYGVNLDITPRKEAEERIMRSESQLRMVTDTVPALISYVDSQEKYRFVNKKYVDWFGKPREEIIGRTVSELVGAQAYRTVKPYIKQALAGRESTHETELVLKGAGTKFVRVSYSPDIGIDGNINGFYVLVSDMTDLKLSKDLLRSTEERIGLIMESLTDYAIFSTDSEGRVESWNRGAECIYGYKPEEIVGLSCEILFEPQDVARGVPIREMRTARKSGRAVDERWHVKKDGSRFFAAGVLMPLYVGGALTGYARVANDLTEKQRRADELQKAHDELEERVAERTAELAEANTALREEMAEREIAEAQRIDLLRRLVSSQESERRRIARDIHDTLGQRLTALRLKIASLKQDAGEDHKFAARVERLQEISARLDSEVSFLAWELRPSALDDLGLAEALGAYVSEWSRHFEIAADFHSEPLPHEPLNRETETHLYRITQEALNNIAKHSRADNVSVVLKRRDDEIILIIEDNGRGFDHTSSARRAESGKGLGLLGMSERASLVGGDVEIESAPGKGTTIYARVPFYSELSDTNEND